MTRPPPRRRPHNHQPRVRVNGRIRAREVRVVGADGRQLGVMAVNDALSAAREAGLDLVEVAAQARPPVCRIVDFGKYRYEQAKREKESRKHQHANKVKEVQLTPNIDPHDFTFKLQHAIDFLCEDMKVKVTLRFRGRQNAHKEIGYKVVQDFVRASESFGVPDSAIRTVGRGISVMLRPLPREKRAKNPRESEVREGEEEISASDEDLDEDHDENQDENPAEAPAEAAG